MVLTETGLAKVFQRVKSFVIAQLNSKASVLHTHTYSEIVDLPNGIAVDSTLDGTSSNAISNSAVSSALDGKINKNDIYNLIYPVGSIYLSVNSVDPSTIFGGTWEQIKDTFLLSSGDTYSIGSTGGEATHTLTIDEIPSHRHASVHRHTGMDDGNFDGSNGPNAVAASDTGYVRDQLYTDYTGGSQPHNNMPPYLTINVWKRVA